VSQSVLIQLADAVKDALTAAAITPEIAGEGAIAATRSYVPEFSLPELGTAKLTVVPSALTAELASRGAHEFDYSVDIGIHRRVADDNETDAMVRFVEEVLDTVRSTAIDIAGLRVGVPTLVANEPIFSPEHLREQRTFVSVVRATYPAIRAVT